MLNVAKDSQGTTFKWKRYDLILNLVKTNISQTETTGFPLHPCKHAGMYNFKTNSS